MVNLKNRLKRKEVNAMYNIKKAIAILSMIAVFASLGAPAYALDIADEMITVEGVERFTCAAQATDIVDTTAMTQNEYVSDLQELTATVSTNLALQRTCELFISSVYASQRDNDNDYTVFNIDFECL